MVKRSPTPVLPLDIELAFKEPWQQAWHWPGYFDS
jgi:hypothetical protein